MIFKIKHKLFFALIMANVFVVLGIYLLSSVSFSNSFRQYLDANREKELAPLVEAVANEYETQNGWLWLEDRRDPTWRNLIDTHVLKSDSLLRAEKKKPSGRNQRNNSINEGPRGRNGSQHDGPRRGHHDSRPKQKRGGDRQEHRRPANDQRSNLRRPPPRHHLPNGEKTRPPPRIFIADSQKKLILGRETETKRMNWIGIKVDSTVVGYLGYFRTLEITSDLDRLFLDRLNTYLSWSVALVILVAGLIALGLSRVLTNPITRLSAATQKMSSGKFETRIEVTTRDEIGDLCKDFNRLSESLESNLNARQQWIADISHELRTPVSILQGELEAIQDGIRVNTVESIDSLHQEIKRLSFLINDLHELSMSDLGALSYRFEQVDLSDIIDSVIESNQQRIQQNQFKVKHITDISHVTLNGDYQRLTQLFLNLLNNSLAYSEPNGLIQISYERSSSNIIVRWSDSEPGVTDEQLAKLFDRLYRTESSRNRNSGGSGLGLSIVSNIVQAHNGSIVALQSALGGITFEIVFPIN